MKNKGFTILSLLLSVIISLIIWNYFSPKVTVTREVVEKDLKPKFHSYINDSLQVFIPYKFSIRNNSLKKIKLKNIICPLRYDGTLYSQLIYSQDGHESLMSGEFNDYTDENIIKPFEKKIFYFYLQELAPKKDFQNAEYVEDLYKKLPAQIVEKHINNLKENVNISEKNDIVLSKLYKRNKDNPIEITLTDWLEKPVMTLYKIETVEAEYEENYIIKSKL